MFDRTDLEPRERLLAAFDAAFDVHAPSCPFIAAAVEVPDPGHPSRVYARDSKEAFAAWRRGEHLHPTLDDTA